MSVDERIEQLLSKVDVPLDDARFAVQLFSAAVSERQALQAKDGDNIRRVCAEEYDALSRRMDSTGIQESSMARNILRTRRLANLLINDKGELNTALLSRVITHLTNHLYSLGPNRHLDTPRQEHLLRILNLLNTRKDLVQMLKQIGKPIGNPLADQMIRETLLLPPKITITHAHAQRAALAAWICHLRQKIGSCFATAPAIIVQDEQPDQFLTDIRELLNTGRLKRTFAGVEYSVPMSVSWGGGDLRRPILLSIHQENTHAAIWNAPGLIHALEAVELLSKDLPIGEKIAHTKALIEKAFPELNPSHPYIAVNVEKILQRILMQHLEITEEDLQAYALRTKSMLHTDLLIQMAPNSSGMGGKGEACSNYYFLIERACSVFKALVENALLKTWEYTVASFAETKSEFTRWNLYSSLGLSPEQPHGIGDCLFRVLKEKIDACNRKVEEVQFEYEHLFDQLKTLEMRVRSVSSEKEGQWVQAEYQSKRYEFQTLEEIRDDWHAKARLFAHLFDNLIDLYDQLFPQFFQEVFDADLHEVQATIYDDSPAGFRLLYKHGRAQTGQWTKIQNPQEFIDALSNFFVTTEPEIVRQEHFKEVQNDISDLITAVVMHVKTQEFLISALQRMGAAHRFALPADPLEHWEQLPAKPWAYVSGGTMSTLVSAYYRREHKPTEVARWVENPTELLVFLVDTLKRVPYKTLEVYLKEPHRSLIMHSPTHAFLLKPGISPLKDAWQTDAYTYTWVRDYLIRPMEQFVLELQLNDEMIEYVIDQLQQQVPMDYRHYFSKVFAHTHGPLHSSDLREYIVDKIDHERGLQYGGRAVLQAEEIDSILYALLPLFPSYQLGERASRVFDQLPFLEDSLRTSLKDIAIEVAERARGRTLFGSQQLLDYCGSILCMGLGKTATAENYPSALIGTLQQLGYAMPFPIFFSDTNWTNDLFSFIVSPGTGSLELWRSDLYGRNASPMSAWKEWLNGSRKDRDWGVYTAPHEYTPSISAGIRLPFH